VLQLHRLPLLPVTGEKPHAKERAKSPVCQDLDDWDTGERKEKEKRAVQLPTIIAAPWLQINIEPQSFWLPARYFFIKVINVFIFLPSQHKMPDQWILLTTQTVTKHLLNFLFNSNSY